MTDLNDTTFIIPIKIDCEDRINNFNINLKYLNFNFKTNVIIYEQGDFIYSLRKDIIQKHQNLNFTFLSLFSLK